jgi:hypothetical protein
LGRAEIAIDQAQKSVATPIMGFDRSARQSLILDGLAACSAQYSDIIDSWRQLDTKAQGVMTMAGVLLASVLAFVPQPLYARMVSEFDTARWLVLSVIGFSMIALLLGVMTSGIRPVRAAYRGDALATAVMDLLRLPSKDANDTLLELHYTRQLAEWQRTINASITGLEAKGRALFAAQFVLVIAVSCVGTFLSVVMSLR